MTKRKLVEALSGFGDDQEVVILLHATHLPELSPGQVIIQNITAFPPWHSGKDDKSNWLIGIEAHSENAEISQLTPPSPRRAGAG